MRKIVLGLLLIAVAFCVTPTGSVSMLSVDPSADWLAAAQRDIAELEYRASLTRKGLQAPNRAHGLRTYFESDGIHVHDRTAAGSPELVSLRLAGLGRDEKIIPVEPGETKADGERVEIRRPGLVEWFVNGEIGLEHGVIVEARPEGDGPLVVDLSVESARAMILGDSVLLETSAGRTLSYANLVVVDSKGTSVAARFETPSESRIRMVMDDESATYPLLIDPLLTGVFDTHFLSDGANSLFGYSVAGAGDVNGDGYADVVVGAYEYDAGETKEGAAFIYLGDPSGMASTNSSNASAQIESNQEFAYLGLSVAGAGDVNGDGFDDVIIGSAFDEGEDAEGAAFIFHGGPAGITDGSPATAQTHLQSDQAEAGLGYSVASAGDVNGDGYGDVIVGSPAYDALIDATPPALLDAGEAYVFLGSPVGVVDGSPISAATRLQGDQGGGSFGATVTSAGDVDGDGFSDVMVGAWHYSAGQADESAAFVYHGGSAGVPSGTASQAVTRIESDYVGNGFMSIAGAGDVNGDGYSDVIVGLPSAGGSTSLGGAAMVFHGSSTGIPSGSPAGGFTSFVYPDQPDASLGRSVASAGDVNGDGYSDVVIGAPRYDAPFVDEGVAFLLLGSAAGIPVGTPSTTAYRRLSVGNPSALFGEAVAGAGDVNGDGYADVIAGATYFGASDEGAAFVFHGGGPGVSNGDPGSADAHFAPELASHGNGISAAPAGDVNGDGPADLIVGLPGFDGGQPSEGAAFVFLGGADGIANIGFNGAATLIQSDEPLAGFGWPVASAGDVNGDGYGDVMILASGIYLGGDGFSPQGAVFIFHGSESGIPSGNLTSAATRLEGPLNPITGSMFGYGLGTAGDVNGDGYADIIVGSAEYSNVGFRTEGAAFLYLGGVGGPADGGPASASARLEGDQVSSGFGGSVGAAGDVDGDGFGDVIVGAHQYDSGQFDEGAAFVFMGSESGLVGRNPANAATQLESNLVGGGFGRSVAGVGDVGGDGYADVMISAPRFGVSQSNGGAAYIFPGGPGGIADGTPATAATKLESNPVVGRFGGDVAGLGDVNGDGSSDVLVHGSLSVSPSFLGAAFIVLGNGDGDGRPVLARQLRSDAAETPIQPGGWTGDLNSGAFEVRMRATHPMGRGRVKLEVETCAEPIPFGDVACARLTSAVWTDVTASSSGVELSETVGNLEASTHYRWRARVLYAPFSVNQAGVVPPPNPTHGPWRRVAGQAAEVNLLPEPDVRVPIALSVVLLAGLVRRRRAKVAE